MSQERWSAVDDFFNSQLIKEDPVLVSAITNSDAAGLPPHHVAPNQGKLLQLLAGTVGAKSILEIGTLGGCSTIWLARAPPTDGRLISLEFDPTCVAVARKNIIEAWLDAVVEIREGAALDSLPELIDHPASPFDLIFIDADKRNNAAYFDWALQLAHSGSLIIADNVVRDGRVIERDDPDPNILGIRNFIASVAREKRVTATTIQTVGTKGYDGFLVARVN